MVKGKRAYITANIKRLVYLEAGYKCSVPNCQHEAGLEIHHIDENPANNSFDNLMLLCAVHHSQTINGKLDTPSCRLIKNILKLKMESQLLKTRKELVESSLDSLNDFPSGILRSFLAGPFFLHPDWYFVRRNEKKSHQNLDFALSEFIFNASKKRNHNIRLIFSFSSRYKHKVSEYVRKSERKKFIEEVIKNIYRLFGQDFEFGPDICCTHTGISSIDMIFDHAVISTFRSAQEKPTNFGILFTEQTIVNYSLLKFDHTFDCHFKGQKVEINTLIKNIENLWSQ